MVRQLLLFVLRFGKRPSDCTAQSKWHSRNAKAQGKFKSSVNQERKKNMGNDFQNEYGNNPRQRCETEHSTEYKRRQGHCGINNNKGVSHFISGIHIQSPHKKTDEFCNGENNRNYSCNMFFIHLSITLCEINRKINEEHMDGIESVEAILHNFV